MLFVEVQHINQLEEAIFNQALVSWHKVTEMIICSHLQ